MNDDNILITGGINPPDKEIRKLREEVEALKKENKRLNIKIKHYKDENYILKDRIDELEDYITENERLKEAISKALLTLNGDVFRCLFSDCSRSRLPALVEIISKKSLTCTVSLLPLNSTATV